MVACLQSFLEQKSTESCFKTGRSNHSIGQGRSLKILVLHRSTTASIRAEYYKNVLIHVLSRQKRISEIIRTTVSPSNFLCCRQRGCSESFTQDDRRHDDTNHIEISSGQGVCVRDGSESAMHMKPLTPPNVVKHSQYS